MDLKKLFSVQKVLRDRINYQGSDRFDKLVLALLVEVGECAQEWRGFKYWSKDQEPRLKSGCDECKGQGEVFNNSPNVFDMAICYICKGKGYISEPLLEEYIDGFTFLLEIGLEIGIDDLKPSGLLSFHNGVIANDFKYIYKAVARLDLMVLLIDNTDYRILFNNYLHLGKGLGFTTKEIEDAYYRKNAINHARQDSGTY